MFCPRLVDRHNSCLSTTEDTCCLTLVFLTQAYIHAAAEADLLAHIWLPCARCKNFILIHSLSPRDGSVAHLHKTMCIFPCPFMRFYLHTVSESWQTQSLLSMLDSWWRVVRSSLFMHVPWGVPLIPSLFFKGVFSTQRSMVNEEHLNALTHFTHSCKLMSFYCV